MVQSFDATDLVECIESIDQTLNEILLAVRNIDNGLQFETAPLLEVTPKLAWTRLLLSNALSDLQRDES